MKISRLWYLAGSNMYTHLGKRSYHHGSIFHFHRAGQTSTQGVGSPTVDAWQQTHHPVYHILIPGPCAELLDQETEY